MTATDDEGGDRFKPHPGFGADKAQAKRFYDSAVVEQRSDGYVVLLDGRTIKTPARNDLMMPSKALADAVAAEWQKQEARLRRRSTVAMKRATLSPRGRESKSLGLAKPSP